MNAINFTRELDKVIIQFREDCERHGTIDEDVEIGFGNGYFTLHAIVVDDDDNDIECEQEFEMSNSDAELITALYFEAYQY